MAANNTGLLQALWGPILGEESEQTRQEGLQQGTPVQGLPKQVRLKPWRDEESASLDLGKQAGMAGDMIFRPRSRTS